MKKDFLTEVSAIADEVLGDVDDVIVIWNVERARDAAWTDAADAVGAPSHTGPGRLLPARVGPDGRLRRPWSSPPGGSALDRLGSWRVARSQVVKSGSSSSPSVKGRGQGIRHGANSRWRALTFADYSGRINSPVATRSCRTDNRRFRPRRDGRCRVSLPRSSKCAPCVGDNGEAAAVESRHEVGGLHDRVRVREVRTSMVRRRSEWLLARAMTSSLAT